MSTEEKRNIGIALTRLCPENLSEALEIVAQNNPSFQAMDEEVDLDIDAQSENTLWRLKFFLKDALEDQRKTSSMGGNTTTKNAHASTITTMATKRRREICAALAKTAKKRAKKLSAK